MDLGAQAPARASKRLRAAYGPDLVLIAVTGRSGAKAHDEAMRAGIDHVLEKPDTGRELAKTPMDAEPGGGRDPVEEPAGPLELADLILDKAEVAAVPGEAFGPSGFLRFSYALGDAPLLEGIQRLQKLFA